MMEQRQHMSRALPESWPCVKNGEMGRRVTE
jgi:hypothetical protein